MYVIISLQNIIYELKKNKKTQNVPIHSKSLSQTNIFWQVALVNVPIIHTCFAAVDTEAVLLTDEALGQAQALGHHLTGI